MKGSQYARYRRKNAPKRKTAYKSVKRNYYKPKSNFVKSVKKVIHGMTENKLIAAAQGDTDIVPMSSSGYTNLTLIPATVAQGAQVNQRIGNQIRLTSNVIKMYFSLNGYNATTNPWQSPIQCCIWVYSFKTLNAYAAQASNVQDLVSNQLFQLNNASVGTTQSIQDLLFESNTEYITVHRKVMFTLNTPTSSATSTGFNSDGHPFKYISLNLSKYVKLMKFNDTASGVTNKNLYMLINTYHTDGTSYASAERMASFTYVQTWKYEDL